MISFSQAESAVAEAIQALPPTSWCQYAWTDTDGCGHVCWDGRSVHSEPHACICGERKSEQEF